MSDKKKSSSKEKKGKEKTDKKDKDKKHKKSKDSKKESSKSVSQQVIEMPKEIQKPPEMIMPKEQVCVNHGQPFEYFCESCEEPVCRQCSILGPHHNSLHRLSSINESYQMRSSKIIQQINTSLIDKKNQLLAQIHRIEYRQEEIHYIKELIERDIRLEYSGILTRLKSAEGLKSAILQHEIHELTTDLNTINDIGVHVKDLTSKGPGQIIEFLVHSRKLYEEIEFLINKPFKVSIDVFPYDLPRELMDKRKQIELGKVEAKVSEFKDEVIWKILQEKKKEQTQFKQEVERSANLEIAEWGKLTDKCLEQLKRYQLICYYCGCNLDDKTVNSKCKVNGKQLADNFAGFTENVPENKFNKTKRHFFGKPNMFFNQQIGEMKQQSAQKQTLSEINNLYQNQMPYRSEEKTIKQQIPTNMLSQTQQNPDQPNDLNEQQTQKLSQTLNSLV